jgi:cytochrome c biogenesis protein
MRCALALLGLIALATALASLIPQHESAELTLALFGPFWSALFADLGLTSIHQSAGYLALIALLLAQLALCLLSRGRELIRPFSRRKLGHLLTHGGLLLVCAGLLLDATAGAFRGKLALREGEASDRIWRTDGGEDARQELPFTVRVRRIESDHASELELIDKRTGEKQLRRVALDAPSEYSGVSLIQAGFTDASRLALRARALDSGKDEPLTLEPGGQARLAARAQQIELSGIAPIALEDTRVEPSLFAKLKTSLGSGASKQKPLLTVPGFQYRLRDASGEAREYSNSARALPIEGQAFLISGERSSAAEPFLYLKIPLDDGDSTETWFALRRLLLAPDLQHELAHRYADAAAGPAPRRALETSAQKTLILFQRQGLASLDAFIRQAVPAAERDQAATLLLRVLEGLAWQALDLAQGGSFPRTAQHARFVRDSLAAISDGFLYRAPVLLEERSRLNQSASVLIASRSPGKPWVGLGALLLASGVLLMLFARPSVSRESA